MTFGEFIKQRLLRYADGALALDVFNALLGVDGDPAALGALLRCLDEEQIQPGILGVQSLRWVLFQPTMDNDATPEDAMRAPYALSLSFVYDGPVEAALEDLLELPSTRRILSHCRDFDGAKAIAYLTERRIDCGYMFRDLGSLANPAKGSTPQYAWDATLSEIQASFGVQRRFEQFYVARAQAAGADPKHLREAFIAEFGRDSFPFPLTPVERRQPDEERVVRRVSEVIRRTQARFARKTGEKKRGAHAKGHGFIDGTFQIEPSVPEHLAKGIFAAQGWTFPLRVRASNSAPEQKADKQGDARGFAMSVTLPVGGRPRFDADEFLFPNGEKTQQQDFLLFSHPEFFLSNVREAATAFSIISTGSGKQQLARLAAFGFGNGKIGDVALMFWVLARRTLNPLNPVFHSATPYLLGKDHVVKYSVEVVRPPCGAILDSDSLLEAATRTIQSVERSMEFLVAARKEGNFLRQALKDDLAAEPVQLKFYVHAVEIARWKDSPETLIDAVEDATTKWKDLDAEKVHVATITLGRQDPTTKEALREGEEWSFNPWNGLEAHRPVGNINRGRLTIMRNSATFRAQKPSDELALSPDCSGDDVESSGRKAAE